MSRRAKKSQGLLRDVNPTASGIGIAAAVLMTAAIFAGSRGLQNFDAALIGYATATVFLAFGITYRYVVWVQSPPARRYLIKGWKAFLSWHNFRRSPHSRRRHWSLTWHCRVSSESAASDAGRPTRRSSGELLEPP